MLTRGLEKRVVGGYTISIGIICKGNGRGAPGGNMNLSIMIKPASSLCNLRCKYCFYHDLADNREVRSYGVMKEETMRKLLERAFEALPQGHNQLSLIFQGGEPMVAGLAFFERLEEMLAEMGRREVKVNRSIQTNGTMIDERWAAFWKKHGYLVGVSLDGPAQVHNELRVDAAGKGTFSRVTSGIACLKKYGVEYNILTVVSAEVARHGQKVYSFLRKNGWNYLQFIPCMDPVSGERQSYSLTAEQYGKFLISTFQEYERERMQGKFVSVRWFDNLLDLAAGYPPESCGMTGVCACHFVAEADGSIYPCDFYVDDEHRLGNVADTGFREMFESEIARRFVNESVEPAQKCKACRWYRICRGGCRRYREGMEGTALGCSTLCRAYEMFFDECGNRVAALARALSRR